MILYVYYFLKLEKLVIGTSFMSKRVQM